MKRLWMAALLAVTLHALILVPHWSRFVPRDTRKPVSRGAVALTLQPLPRPETPAFPVGSIPPNVSASFAPAPPEPAPRMMPPAPKPEPAKKTSPPEPLPEPDTAKTEPGEKPPEPAQVEEKPKAASSVREGAEPTRGEPGSTAHRKDAGTASSKPADRILGTKPRSSHGLPGTSGDVTKTPSPPPLQEAVPFYRENPGPVYPRLARQRGYEGTVLLEVLVNREGRAIEVDVATSCGHRLLDKAAQEAVRDWRFEPAKRGDEAVDMRVRIPVRFRLQ